MEIVQQIRIVAPQASALFGFRHPSKWKQIGLLRSLNEGVGLSQARPSDHLWLSSPSSASHHCPKSLLGGEHAVGGPLNTEIASCTECAPEAALEVCGGFSPPGKSNGTTASDTT